MSKTKNRYYSIIYYVIFSLLMIIVLHKKVAFHIDEYLSYGLANAVNQGAIAIDWGISYDSNAIDRLFSNYLSADSNARFNFSNVWNNQAMDVHPPLFYAVLHTISSFFPETFSPWYAGAINIIFALLTLYILRKLSNDLFQASFFTNILSITFILSAEILSATSFFRMYIVALFFVTLLTYIFVTMIDNNSNWKNYFFLFITSVLCALTHYYCVVYLVFICLVYGVWLLTQKTWKPLFTFIGTMALAGATAIAIFPAMLQHVFSGYRGTNSIDNLTNTSINDYIERLTTFYEIFNQKLLGGMLPFIVILLIIIIILSHTTSIFKHSVVINKPIILKWCLIIIPSLLYFFLIAKIAVYNSERYMVPIYATTFLSFIGILFYITKKVCPLSAQNICLIIICIVMVINGWQNENWPHLYLNSQKDFEKISVYENTECLVIYDSLHSIQTAYEELRMFNNISFIDKYNYYWIAEWECTKENELIVITDNLSNNELENILSYCPNLNSYEEIGNYRATTTYYLYSNQ